MELRQGVRYKREMLKELWDGKEYTRMNTRVEFGVIRSKGRWGRDRNYLRGSSTIKCPWIRYIKRGKDKAEIRRKRRWTWRGWRNKQREKELNRGVDRIGNMKWDKWKKVWWWSDWTIRDQRLEFQIRIVVILQVSKYVPDSSVTMG